MASTFLKIVRLVHVPLTLLALVVTPMPGLADRGDDSAFDFSEEDLRTLPPYCVAKVGRQKTDKAAQSYWSKHFGAPNWLHLHHYCFGLKAMQLAYRNFSDKNTRAYFSKVAQGNINYVLKNAEPNFFMRPELFLQRGRAKVLGRDFDGAQEDYQTALSLDRKYIDAWAAMSDLLVQMGEPDKAIKILEEAVRETDGENKKLTLRLDELQKKHSNH